MSAKVDGTEADKCSSSPMPASMYGGHALNSYLSINHLWFLALFKHLYLLKLGGIFTLKKKKR